MDYTNGIKVVVGNEGLYLQGELRDQAITLPVSGDELSRFLHDSKLVSHDHREIYIADFPDGVPFGNTELFEHASIEDMNLLAWQMESMDPNDLDKVEEWMQAFSDPKSVTQLMNLIEQADLIEKVDFEYTGGESPEENYGFYIVDQDPGLKEAMEAAGIAIDYYRTGVNRLDDVTLTDTGFFVDTGEAPDLNRFSHDELVDMYGDAAFHDATLDSNVKEWYMETYPTDELGAEIDGTLTFDEALSAMEGGKDIYDALGVGDSLVRERVFEGLSDATGKSYGEVYNLWLKKGLEQPQAADAIDNGIDDLASKAQEASDKVNETHGGTDEHNIDPR